MEAARVPNPSDSRQGFSGGLDPKRDIDLLEGMVRQELSTLEAEGIKAAFSDKILSAALSENVRKNSVQSIAKIVLSRKDTEIKSIF